MNQIPEKDYEAVVAAIKKEGIKRINASRDAALKRKGMLWQHGVNQKGL